MIKVKVEWTVEVTEKYSAVMDFDDFAVMFDGEPPEVDQVVSGDVDKSDIDTEELAGEETDENRDSADVDERYVTSFELIEA